MLGITLKLNIINGFTCHTTLSNLMVDIIENQISQLEVTSKVLTIGIKTRVTGISIFVINLILRKKLNTDKIGINIRINKRILM